MATSPIPVLLMLAAVGAAAIGFAASLLGHDDAPIQTAGHPLTSDSEPTSLHVTNRGIHVMSDDVRIKLTVDGASYTVGHDALERALGDAWRRGEVLCVVGDDEACLVQGGERVTAEIRVASRPSGTFRWHAP